MRVITGTGIPLGFIRRNDDLAEIAFERAANIRVGQRFNIDGQDWEIVSIKPSQFIKTLLVGTLRGFTS